MFLTKRAFCKMMIGASSVLAMLPVKGAFASGTERAGEIINPLKSNGSKTMTFTLPPLPYAQDALEPHITANTLSFHYGKHHQAYVTNLNKLVEGTDLANASLEEVIKKSAGDATKAGIFNNSAQVWNHTFYWHSMKPQGGGKPQGSLAKQIEADFGSYDKFVEEFKNAATTQFGSGWAWLVVDGSGKLKVTKTGNADLPMVHGQTAILTIDVWEHAYYLDFQNRRPDYISTFLDKLANWQFAQENFDKAQKAKAA
ncbi:MAG: sodB [Rickettsiales bacterium]|jgi:Fe-Mn family superoxide dismutase|nr:sodB [Rickettsiales bacterium]